MRRAGQNPTDVEVGKVFYVNFVIHFFLYFADVGALMPKFDFHPGARHGQQDRRWFRHLGL